MSNESPEAPLDAGEERTRVTIRRAPKISAFIVVGALAGFLITLVLTSLFPADPTVGFGASLGYFSLFGVSIGAMIGAIFALVADRRASRHSAEAIAGKLTVHVEPESSGVDENVPDSVPNNDG